MYPGSSYVRNSLFHTGTYTSRQAATRTRQINADKETGPSVCGLPRRAAVLDLAAASFERRLRAGLILLAVRAALSYFARGFGRAWNFTILGRAPLPPSWCQGEYIE